MDRQRILTIFGIAWVSALLLTWFLWARTKAPRTEKMVKVVAAARDLPAGTKISKSDLRVVSIPAKDAPRTALEAPEPALGRALLYPISANEPLSGSRLSSEAGAEGVPALIEPGMRAISVPFTDASGASGLILPRSHVDVLFTRSGSLYEAMTITLLENVRVLSVGRVTEIETTLPGAKKAPARTSGNQTATLVVTPEQAEKLELAKNQGKIGLVLRNPLDKSVQAEPGPATLEQIEPLILTRAGKKAGRPAGNINDPNAWSKLIGEDEAKKKQEEKKEPPKPRLVVDVYRGEKHVQEIFQ